MDVEGRVQTRPHYDPGQGADLAENSTGSAVAAPQGRGASSNRHKKFTEKDLPRRHHDLAAARDAKIFDLQVDDRSDIAGRESEIAAIANYAFATRICITDLGRCSAVDILTVEDGEKRVARIDRLAVRFADPRIQRPPRVALLIERRKMRDAIHFLLRGQFEGIDDPRNRRRPASARDRLGPFGRPPRIRGAGKINTLLCFVGMRSPERRAPATIQSPSGDSAGGRFAWLRRPAN